MQMHLFLGAAPTAPADSFRGGMCRGLAHRRVGGSSRPQSVPSHLPGCLSLSPTCTAQVHTLLLTHDEIKHYV